MEKRIVSLRERRQQRGREEAEKRHTGGGQGV
jgi:hypothetical protein